MKSTRRTACALALSPALLCVCVAQEAGGAAQTIRITGSAERPEGSIVERRSRGGALFGSGDLREVPFTVNIVTSADIANRQAKTIGEALAGDPAVRNDYGATGAYPTESFNIRGFSITTSGILKDGMPMANQVTQSLENIEQVEVIRGPMGFRYGFVSPGGAINLVSKRPTSAPLAAFTFSTDEYGSAQGHLDLGGRTGERGQFGWRVNAVLGELKNFARPIDIHRRLVAGAFDWKPADGTVLTLSLDDYRYRAGPDLFHYTVPDTSGNEIKGIAPDGYWGQRFLPDTDFTTRTASLNLDSKLTEALRLSTQVAIYDSQRLYAATNPVNAQPNGDFQMSAYRSRYDARNLGTTTFLNYAFDAGITSHSLTAGFMLTRSKAWNRQTQFSGLLGSTGAGGVFTPFVNNFFTPRQFPDTTFAPGGPRVQVGDGRERGSFVSDEIRIGDRWRVLLAARRSSYDERGNFQRGRSSSTDPTVGAMVELTPELSVYASHATGLMQGGIAPATAANALQQLPAQKSKQIELGFKSDLGRNGDAATLDGAVFRIEKAAEFTDARNVYVQSGRQVHTGAELRVAGRVLPFLTLSSGVQWLKARLTGNPATAGQTPQNVPRINAAFNGDWAVAAVPGLVLTTTVLHAGRREVNVPNIAAKAGAYTRLDLGARWATRLAGRDVTARAKLENATDRSYYNAGWYKLYEFGAPRTASASVEVRF